MQEPQVAFQNEEYIYYASANASVMENEDSSLFENEAVYPEEEPKSEVFLNLPQNILELQNDLWSKVKSGSLSINSKTQDRKVYTCSAVLGVVVVFLVCTSFIRKSVRIKRKIWVICMSKTKCALFDLDGTLVNTIDDLAGACEILIKKYNFDAHWTKEDYLNFVGNGAKNWLKEPLTKLLMRKLLTSGMRNLSRCTIRLN